MHAINSIVRAALEDQITAVTLLLLALTLLWAAVYLAVRLWEEWRMERCPLCRGPMEQIIYFGLPGRLCLRESCSVMIGPASWLARWWFDGIVFAYTGCYLRGLWLYLRGPQR